LDKANDYKLNVTQYIQFVQQEQPDTIVLINPNNPNGAYIDHQDMERILRELQFVETIILDESFVHFAYDDHNFEMLATEKLVADYPNLVVIKSMSKDFGIAGVRAGYGVMAQDRVQTLLQKGYLWNSNCLAEYFFKLYVRPDFAAQYEKIRINYIQESILFFEELATIPSIKTYPSKANFVLVELLNGMSSKLAVSLLLMRYGIYVRTCEDKIGLTGEFIRVASRSKEENSYIIESFRDFFRQIELA
jgi:histidinol-phosphate/aromatic aminotransferase/cobyric acid decarboxylase-like protein